MVLLDLVPTADGVRMRVRVKPRASKSRLVGVRDGVLEVAVAAPPVDGEANAELVRTLAGALGIGRTSVSVVSGESSRHKLVALVGVEPDRIRAALSEILG